MEDDKKKSAKMSPNAWRQTLGVDSTRYADDSRRSSSVFTTRYNVAESQRILRAINTPNNGKFSKDVSSSNASGIISYFQPRHEESGRKTANIKSLKYLCPEVNQAQVLVASSIMSPNDLQDGVFTFTFPNVDALDVDGDLYEKVSKVYSEYFNDQLDLGGKCYEWISEAMYSSGAKAILLLPPGLHETLANRTADDIRHDHSTTNMRPAAGLESFDSYMSRQPDVDNFMLSNRPTRWVDIFGDEETCAQDEMRNGLAASLESLNLRVPDEYTTREPLPLSSYSSTDSEYKECLEAMVVNMRTKLANGDGIRITENPEIVRFNVRRHMKAKRDIDDKLDNRYGINKYQAEPIISLDVSDIPILKHSHPTLIELPTEAVIPICVPGAPSEHLGYFIMIDETGQPLVYSEAEDPDPNKFYGDSMGNGNASEAFAAALGTSHYVRVFGTTKAANDTGKAIFNHFLDKFMREHLKGLVPNENIEISRFNSIATAMFYRLLSNKKTTLVYAPPRLLHYLAYDYRPDGSGEPKPENIEFILSLRTTLMVANILAQANDAINHKKIEFEGGDNIKNMEQIIDLIKRMFIAKNKISGSIDPADITREIIDNSITVVPKNIPGLGGSLNVDIQSAGSQSVRVDDSLLENLSELLISNLDVPPSALNQLAEPEFSRSLVTYNLFFAKKINMYQKITCRFMTDLVRSYTRYDHIFQSALSRKLNTSIKRPLKKKMPPKVAKMAMKNRNSYSSLSAMVQAILENVVLNLPKSNIVADKTLFEEINAFVDNVDRLSTTIYNADLVPSDDSDAQDALNLVRARWKYNQIKAFLASFGNLSMLSVSELEDLANIEEYTDDIQILRNIRSGVNKHANAITAAGEEDGDFGGGSSDDGDDFGGDDGDDFDMGDGGDDDFDIGDDETGGDEDDDDDEG